MTHTKQTNKRKFLRYKPTSTPLAYLDLRPGDQTKFTPTVAALVIDEAYGGCGLVTTENPALKEGTACVAQVGPLSPLKSEIVWIKRLDDQVVKIGLKYKE